MKGNLLIIDDNPMDLKVVVHALERTGYACHAFTDHREALDWLSTGRPQMIFLDLEMPKVSGYDLIEKFRWMEYLAQVPILIISGKNSADDIKKAISLGANDYVVKPLDALVIQEKVRRIAEAQGGFSDVEVVPGAAGEAFFIHSLTIEAVSEFGLRLRTAFGVRPGETLEIGGLLGEIFGAERILVRCLAVDQVAGHSEFIAHVTFVGFGERQRKVLRTWCRQQWVLQKKTVLKEDA